MAIIQRILVLGIGFLLGLLVSDAFTQTFIEAQVDLESVRFHAFKRSDFYRSSKAARNSNPFDVQRTLARLQNLYPYQAGFTETNLFQFGDVAESDPNFKINAFAELWKSLNPDYQYHYLIESDADEIIRTGFEKELPEVYEAYRLLPKSILKSDFARYLVVFMFGGVYSEIDTKPCLPIDDWDPTDSQLLVGISTDNNVLAWQHSPVRLSFAHYTFKAKRHHPFLAMLISEIVKKTFVAHLEDSIVYDENIKGMESCRAIKTPDWTGSSVFTETLFQYMNSNTDEPNIYQFNLERNQDTLHGPDTNATVSWRTFSAIKEPVKVDDTFVLPLESFGSAGSALSCENNNIYVIHGTNIVEPNNGNDKDKKNSYRGRVRHKLANSSRRGRKRPNSKKND